MNAPREDRRSASNRVPTALAAAALFIALGSGAYAAVGANSIGAKQIQANAVGSSELAAQAVGPAELKSEAVGAAALADQAVSQAKLKDQAVGEAQMQDNSIGQAKLKAQSVGEQQMKANAIGEAQMKANSIGEQQMKANAIGEAQMKANAIGQAQLKAAAVGAAQLAAAAVGSPAIQDGSIQPADLSAAATPTLYTDNDEPGVTITGDTAIAALNLPAGNYLVSAGVEAVHTGTTSYTRLECYLTQAAPAATLDFAKVRLAPNVSSTDSLIFAKPHLQGPTVLPATTTVTFRCTTTGATSTIDLTHVRMSALRVPAIVQQ